MNKECQVCGEKAFSYYPLCKKHLQMKSEGLVIKNEKTGKWELKRLFNPIITKTIDKTKNEDKNKTEETKINKNNVITINEENKSKCITCGRTTNGLLFCSSCYHKYKDKDLLFKITNCSNVELLDESYEGRYTCKDGHIVKSKSERDIDNYLFEHNILHAYEKKLSYGANENEVLHPDFYLQDYLGKGKHVYIEHWGYEENNIQYTKTKKFKMPKYQELGITLVCTYEKPDANDIESALDRKLKREFIKENQINFEQ